MVAFPQQTAPPRVILLTGFITTTSITPQLQGVASTGADASTSWLLVDNSNKPGQTPCWQSMLLNPLNISA